MTDGCFDLFFRGAAARLRAVKKHSKAILLGLGALLVVIVFGSLCLHGYIQSARSQERIQAQLSEALGMPLKLTNTSFSPWSGVRITGITIPQGGTNFLEAGSFTASYRLFPLLIGKFTIPEIRVDAPKLVWRKDAKGKWRLPALDKQESASAGEAEPKPEPAREKKEGGPVLDISRLQVKGGAVQLFDEDGSCTLACTGVNVICTTVTATKIEGIADIEHLVWAESLVLEKVRAPFVWHAGELTLPALTATLAGGPVRGKFKGQPKTGDGPFEASFDFDQADLERMATNAGWKPGQASGVGSGRLTVQGNLEKLERITGPGQFQIRDGRFKQLDLFQTIGKALDIRELSDLRLKEGSGEFRLGDKKIHLEKMTLSAVNLHLGAKGTVGFDQKVDLAAQLGLEEDLLKQLPELLRESFGKSENGQRLIGFRISGTTEKLRTNLLDQLIGQKVGRQFDDLLSGLFGTKNKDDEKKKKEEEDRKKEEKKEEKRKKKEAEKASAQAAAAAAPGAPNAATPVPAALPAAPVRPVAPATTTITPVKP